MKFDKMAQQYIEQHRQEAQDLLIELAKIPAPSSREKKRAEFCRQWFSKHGAKQVFVDDVLNVIVPIGYSEDKPLIIFVAHSDVVFPDEEELPLRICDGRIFCPGIGDDTTNVVALMFACRYFIENHIEPSDIGILVVINAAEEGLGNLNGTRHLMQRYGKQTRWFISFDSWNGRIGDVCVGSKRYHIEIKTEGGHSYEKFGNRNAIRYLASLIDVLYTIKLPIEGKTTFNVGVIRGGTSINTIAQQAEMLFEIRSDCKMSLEYMEKHFVAAIEYYRTKGIEIKMKLIGERPCMGNVDPDKQYKLRQIVADIVKRQFGTQPSFHSVSSDCNIPLSMGIPSLTVGCFNGGGAHTREEYIEIDSLLPGLNAALELMLSVL